MNQVVDAVRIDVTEFAAPDGTAVPVVQLTFTTQTDPADLRTRRIWPTLVLRPHVANELLRSLSTAVHIVHTPPPDTPGKPPLPQ